MGVGLMRGVQEVMVQGRRLRYRVRHGSGPPLLLCNGIGAGMELLEPFVDELDPTIPVVSFDVPGVGGSEVSRLPYTYHTLAFVLTRLMRNLGFARFDVLGISWGGGLAQQIAFQAPRRCRRLVLVATGTGSAMVPGKPSILAKMVTPRRYRDSDYATGIASQLYGGELRERPDAVRELLDAHSRTSSTSGYVMQLLAAAGWTSLPWLPLIRQKTLIIAGTDDPIIPVVNARILHCLIPHSELILHGGGHLSLVASADELAPPVSKFLREPADFGVWLSDSGNPRGGAPSQVPV